MRILSIVCILSTAIFSTSHVHAGFAAGFERGSRAAQEGLEIGQRRAELLRQWDEMRRRYGTPDLDRLDALERNSDEWFFRIKAEIERVREKQKSN